MSAESIRQRKPPTAQTADRSFTIPEDFTTVRKILVRTDATKQIVTMTGDSEYLDQHWNTVGGGLEGLNFRDLKWRLQLAGDLTVRMRDPYVGEQVITLHQDVLIDPDQVNAEVELVKPSERLAQYAMSTSFQRQSDGSTLVRQKLTQQIVTDAPWFAHSIADHRVHQAALRALENQEQAIRAVITDNRDRKWLLLP